MKVKFSFVKTTKNFHVFRELDSKGVQFPEDWDKLRTHPEQHKVGSIYIRSADIRAADGTSPDQVEAEFTFTSSAMRKE